MGAKPKCVELADGSQIPILYEDRSVIAIDKPPGWMLVPFSWQKTDRNLQAAISSSVAARDYWARSRNLKYLQFVHRLDAETSGVLLFARSRGALDGYTGLFEARKMEKAYLAVVDTIPARKEWVCRLPLAPHPKEIGKMHVNKRDGKQAETRFRVLANQTRANADRALVEARPVTGRTHQVRLHLAESGSPVVGDRLYGIKKMEGSRTSRARLSLALRSVFLSYVDPFTRRRVRIAAPWREFAGHYGFDDFENWAPDPH